MQGTNHFIVFSAKTLAETGAIVRTPVLHRKQPLCGFGDKNTFIAQFKLHHGAGTHQVLQIGFGIEYFDPMHLRLTISY